MNEQNNDQLEKKSDDFTVPKDQWASIGRMFLDYQTKNLENDRLRQEKFLELQKRQLEAERESNRYNKIYGCLLTVSSLALYSLMMWLDKASEGFGILITAVVTASVGGIFKGIMGKKRGDNEFDAEE